jgi:cysteine synthase
MAGLVHSIEELVGRTPLMELDRFERQQQCGAHLLAKLEFFNPTGSVKDRAALSMLNAAEEAGLLKPGGTIVERPETKRTHPWQEPEREATLDEIAAYCRRTGAYFNNQAANPANPEAHYRTTGPEIWQDTEGHVDILVCMAGTGGTGFGTASYLRSRNPNLQVVLVQPHPDSRLTPEHPDAQIIDGVLPAYDVPESALSDYLRPDWSDACINVRTEEAYETAHEVLRAEGLFLGTSAAAALHAAVQVGRRPENQGKNIVVIVPDNGMKYLSTPMYRQK